MSLLNLILFSNISFAQDSIDSHGFSLMPSQQGLHDGLETFRSQKFSPGASGSAFLLEYAKEPLVLFTEYDNEVVIREPYVDNLMAANLSTFYAFTDDIALGLSVPLVLGDTSLTNESLALGTTRLNGFLNLINNDALDVSLSANLDMPGISNDPSLHSDRFSGGLTAGLSTSTNNETFSLSVNAGLQFNPQLDFYNLKGREVITENVMASYQFHENAAIRAELVGSTSLYKNIELGTESPVEALLSVRALSNDSLGWTLGASKSLTRGVSAATFRVFAGVQLDFGVRNKEECLDCPNSSLEIFSDGEHIIVITDGQVTQELNSGDVVNIPSGTYHVLGVRTPAEELVKVNDDELLLISPIYFDFDKASIKFPDSTEILNALIATLNAHEELTKIEVAGHTDARGTEKYNQDLSQRRVNAVVEYLTAHGISSDRLVPVGYGESDLALVDCKDDYCHQLNRRVRFMIKEQN